MKDRLLTVKTRRKKRVARKLHPVDLFFLFFSLLLGARATLFTSNLDPRENPVGFFLAVAPSVFSFFYHKLYFSNKAKIAFGVICSWIVIQFLTNHPFKYIQYGLFLWHIFSAYVLVNVFRTRLFYFFEKYTVILTKISLALWILMHIIGPENMASLGLFEPGSGTSAGSFLIFNVPDIVYYEGTGILGFHRNCGFCWEPGIFACLLVLAIFFNLLRTNNRIKDNKDLWILIIALATTFSTTGYIALMTILLTHYTFGKIKFTAKNISMFCLVIAGVFYLFQLPFMKEKILNRSDKDSFVTENVNSMNTVAEMQEVRTVDRFEGMALDLLNIQDKPLFGYGLSRETSFVYREITPYLLISNGTTKNVASFGILLSVLMIVFLLVNSVYLTRISKAKDKSFFLLYIVISVSYSFATIGIFIAMSYFQLLSAKTVPYHLWGKKDTSSRYRKRRRRMKGISGIQTGSVAQDASTTQQGMQIAEMAPSCTAEG